MPILPAVPPRPLRTKRNFKSLQVSEALPPIVTEGITAVNAPAGSNLVPTRPAPPALPAGMKRRPPPLGASPGDLGFLSPGGLDSDTGTGSARPSAVRATLSSTLAKLEMVQFDLRDADLRKIAELGQGNGGSVEKVEHMPSGTIMAKKVGYSLSRSPGIWDMIFRIWFRRSYLLIRNAPYESKFYANSRSCMIVSPNL